MNNPYLIPALRGGPAIVRKIVASASRKIWDDATDPRRFTFREAIAHLADWEPIFLDRMQLAVADPGAIVRGIDESERAERNLYSQSSPLVEVERYVQRREQTIAWLQARNPEDWASHTVHATLGRQSLADQASMLVCHDTYHIEHLLGFENP